jgi:NAD(P)-dependent dehydrogenase (short-subunit alcohol dehydrogenase family)
MMRSIEEGGSPRYGEEVKKKFESTIPLVRSAEPLEIAKLVLFLASNDSQYITGASQVIDEGISAQ